MRLRQKLLSQPHLALIQILICRCVARQIYAVRLPPGGSWRRRRLRENALHEGFHKPKVAQAPSVTLRVPPHPLADGISEEGFFAAPIITQIDRENNISAEIYVCP